MGIRILIGTTVVWIRILISTIIRLPPSKIPILSFTKYHINCNLRLSRISNRTLIRATLFTDSRYYDSVFRHSEHRSEFIVEISSEKAEPLSVWVFRVYSDMERGNQRRVYPKINFWNEIIRNSLFLSKLTVEYIFRKFHL